MAVLTRAAAAASDDTDAVVIGQARQEPERFATVFDRYYLEVHRYAARRLGGSLADDIAAETFLIAFDQRGRYDTARPDARPWLYGIASNLIARHQRTEVRQFRALGRVNRFEVAEGHADRVAVRLDVEAVRGQLAAALAKVAARDRDVLLLVAWAGFSCEEAAQALEIPSGTARSRLHRARKKVRAALGGVDPTVTGEDND
ncbi:RNA polymerase sigma factor [Micromonospora sp. NPDC047557]|uniref:RNA polymerase sigma factor n=1 Tax=Micromonospora sp. NPDC047557 TaxID=3364250 RepID=UPI003717CDBD